MGLTANSTGINILHDSLKIERNNSDELVIALAGNPNVGKSTVFNSLTGLKQHTGNWPGKTVTNACGKYNHKDKTFIMVDLPGTYSLMANSVEEEVARDFVCFGNPDATVIVTDATCLERNMNLVLQTIEITDRVVVCVNLMDEAKRKKIHIDCIKLSEELGVPVVPTNAREGQGLKELMNEVYQVALKKKVNSGVRIQYNNNIEKAIDIILEPINQVVNEKMNSRWTALRLLENDKNLLNAIRNNFGDSMEQDDEFIHAFTLAKKFLVEKGYDHNALGDEIVSSIVHKAEDIGSKVIHYKKQNYNEVDRKIDKVLTSKILGIPIMLVLLGIVFWLTITGANYPSKLIATLLFNLESKLTIFFENINSPYWLHGILVLGAYRTLAWVVAVMLPPMAIFFPLFTLLEDLGYLPRVAFNLDKFFKKACAHGKQALTMCMGFGCNAAGVIGCRIIDSPRERLIATITNNFVPCNGRFPTLIAISSIFIGATVSNSFRSLVSTLSLTAVVLFGILMTLFVSKILSKTILKGMPSSFTLELPPYRKPQIGKIIIRSVFDRTLFVLGRAVAVAAPAGLVIWIMANINVNDISILTHCATFLDPFAQIIGLDGYILMAFILGLPANEIVVPIIIMSYMSSGALLELESLEDLKNLLVANGWTWLTGVCVMLFSLMHYPCGTTLWTIKKETQSLKWTLVSFLVPTIIGLVVCFVVANVARLLGLV